MISSTSNRINYTGNGSLATYAYPFYVLDEDHLFVYIDGVLKTISTHYSVTGVGNPSGGNIIFVTPPASDTSIVILRIVPLTQLVDYVAHDAFPADTHEQALDKLTMMAQQASETYDRCVKVSLTSLLSGLTLPEGATKAIRWNTAGDALELWTPDDATALNVITTLGDMIRGGTAGAAERVGIGSEGDSLVVYGGKPNWKSGLAGLLTNAEASQVDLGTVCYMYASGDSQIKKTTAQSDTRKLVVALENVSASTEGRFAVTGIATVLVQGNVTRGNYIRTSATSGRAEDAGSVRVAGSFGIALTGYSGGSAGSVVALLLGDTMSAYKTISFTVPGGAATGTNVTPSFIMPFAGTIVKAYAYSRTAPTGADLIFDINKNGTTIWATQANRLKVAASANTGTATTFDTTSLAENDRLDLDIDQVGSSVAGADITVELKVA